MGPILALGIAVMVVAGLTLLPAILATLGRRAFWPAVPRSSARAAPAARCGAASAAWSARARRRRPRSSPRSWSAGALGNLGGREPLDFSEAFRDAARVGAGARR